MAVIKRKTKKAITKQINKLVKQHGAEIAMGLATGLISTVIGATTADPDAKSKKPKAKGQKKKDAVAEKPGKKAKKNGGKKSAKKGKENEKVSAN